MNGQSDAVPMILRKPLPGVWSTLVCGLMGSVFVIVAFAVNPRLGVGILALVTSLVLLHIGFEAVVYGIVAVTVVLVDGSLMTRDPEQVPFRMGLGLLNLMEIPIYLLFLAYLTRRRNLKQEKPFGGILVSTPLDWPLYAWLVAFPVFALYGMLLGHSLEETCGYGAWRSLFIAILLYFLVTSIFREYTSLRQLWRWFFVLASAKALYSLILVTTKIDPPFPLVFGQGPVGEGPENVMYLFAALPALAILLFRAEKDREWRALLLFGASVLVTDIALSEKRDPQLGLLIGLAVLAWHLPRREKIRWGVGVGCFILVIVSSGVLVNCGSSDSGIGASLSRYNEVVEFVQAPRGNVPRGNNVAFHLFDLIDGWEKIKQRPLLGQGFGGRTERNLTALVGGQDVTTDMIHNQYLTFWLKMGVAGPILMLWLIGSFLYHCRRKLNGVSHSFGSATVIGICAAICADVVIEFWGANWIANTKTAIVIFLSMGLAIGFLRCCSENTTFAWRSECLKRPLSLHHAVLRS